MVAQKQNFVEKVAMQAGVGLGNTLGHLQTPGALATHADNAAGNFGKIAEIGMHAANMAQFNQPNSANDASFANSGPSFARTAISAAALIGIGAMAPALAPIAAGVALVGAASDAVNFSIGHAGVGNALGGELSLAASAATFDKDNNMTSYVAACDGVTSDVKTGQSLAAMAAPPTAPLKGMHNLDKIASSVAEEYDPIQIQKDVKHMLDKQQQTYSWATNKLDMLGLMDPKVGKDLGVDNAMAEIKLDTPRPKALNVGMGAPSMG